VLAALHLTMQQVIDANNTPAGRLNAHLRNAFIKDIGAHTGYVRDNKGEGRPLAKPSAEHGAAPPPPAYVTNPNDCSHYWGENMAYDQPPATPGGSANPKVICGYSALQLQQAYGLDRYIKAGIDGRGIRVAIVDAGDSPTIASDTARYFQEQGLPQFKPGQFIDMGTREIRNAPNEPWGLSDWQAEQALDIEAVHGLAPGATIVYVPALDPTDWNMQEAVNTVVDKHLADIESNSWSQLGELPLQEATPLENDFVQAATEGISMLYASGDSRDNLPNGFLGPDYQSTSPWVTSVGGTSLGIGANGEHLWETPWGTLQVPIYDGKVYTYGISASSGAGGGTSIIFAEPWYQKGPGPNGQPHVVQQTQQNLGIQLTVRPDGYISDAKVQYMRSSTDVSMDADPQTGFLIGSTQTYPDGSVHYVNERIGGTSLATPLFAATLAIASQRHGPVGFVNPALYEIDHRNPNAFYDVTGQEAAKVVVRVNYRNGIDDSAGYDVSLRFLGYDWTLLANPGYDQPTGIGTPTAELVKELGG
jgi:subtilase family serine protease